MSHLRLRACAVEFAFGGRIVLRGAEMDVAGGRRVALLGANGSGKTTLLRCLSGALRPDAGQVLLDEVPVRYDRGGLRRHRQLVQLVLQDPDDQLFSADVARDVSFGPTNLGLSAREVAERVDEALALLDITELADRPVHRLSFGQRKRVAIAGAVAMRPCLLLLDEPTAGLDPAGIDSLLAALRRLEEHRTTVVLATHDVDLALAWADEAAVVIDAEVRQGDPVRMLGDVELLARANLRRPWVLELAHRLGLPADPDLAPLRDLAGIAQRISDGLRDGAQPGAGTPQPANARPDSH